MNKETVIAIEIGLLTLGFLIMTEIIK